MLDQKKTFTYLSNKFGIKKSSQGWWKFICPVCGGGKSSEMSCAVNLKSETVKCWRAKCGYKSNLSDFIAENENIDGWYKVKEFIEEFEPTNINITYYDNVVMTPKIRSKVIDFPFGYTPLMEGNGIFGKRARTYLSERGFDIEQLDYEGFGYCSSEHEDFSLNYFGYIIIPFVKKGKLVYYIGRDFLDRDNKYKYKNPSFEKLGIGKSELLFNEDAIYEKRFIYLVEGWSCAKSIGDEGVAYLGNKLSPVQNSKILKSGVRDIVFIPDVGAYENALKMAVDFIGNKNVKILDLEKTGLTSPEKNDVNSIGFEKLEPFCEKLKNLNYGDLWGVNY